MDVGAAWRGSLCNEAAVWDRLYKYSDPLTRSRILLAAGERGIRTELLPVCQQHQYDVVQHAEPESDYTEIERGAAAPLSSGWFDGGCSRTAAQTPGVKGQRGPEGAFRCSGV